jgi:YggT family protein
MQVLMNILSTAASVYMFAIIIRIILTWFRGSVRPPDILCRVTDPYLDWFRRFTFLRIGYMDLSPIAALGVLTVVSQIFSLLARYGKITLGIILAILLQAVWSIVSFFIIFLAIVLVLRLIALLTNQNIYGTFWRVIDTISQPVLYRINRTLFKGRIVDFRAGILVSIGILAVCYAGLSFLVSLLFGVLSRLPF